MFYRNILFEKRYQHLYRNISISTYTDIMSAIMRSLLYIVFFVCYDFLMRPNIFLLEIQRGMCVVILEFYYPRLFSYDISRNRQLFCILRREKKALSTTYLNSDTPNIDFTTMIHRLLLVAFDLWSVFIV